MAVTWENAPANEVPSPPPCRAFRQLRPHEVDELVALFDPAAGMGVKELASKFGIHRSTVGKFLKERGIETRPTLKPEDIPTAAALYRSGLTLAQVAQRYGIAKDTVRLKLVEAGVEIRAFWESRRP
jgi:DNA invertase Pin-like site-specific DNA recombinase